MHDWFFVRLELEELTLEGLEALDLRRRLKLADATILSIRHAMEARAPVSEGFARAHFPRNKICLSAKIPITLLCPGDLADDPRWAGGATFSPDLSNERIRELWLAARQRADRPRSG